MGALDVGDELLQPVADLTLGRLIGHLRASELTQLDDAMRLHLHL